MEVESFLSIFGADFYTGVPDSQLKSLINYLMKRYGIDYKHHIIAANEGNCLAIAAGYYLATYKIPIVYMQNSGEGNIINPAASLTSEKVYGIPIIYIIGWRGEPGVHDEPQHILQGEITLKLLEDLNIKYEIISKTTKIEEVKNAYDKLKVELNNGKSIAFIIRKDSLIYDNKVEYINDYNMNRECIIQHILKYTLSDPVISTTGKISRELYEIRDHEYKGVHNMDFLTVGSMGHCSSIALGIAINKPNKKVWCIDGDGAVLMHLGSLAIIGQSGIKNLIHIVINNCAHESVGGMPTATYGKNGVDISGIAKNCGYTYTIKVYDYNTLDIELQKARDRNELCLIEIMCSIGSRKDLGRPKNSPIDNKNMFMQFLKQ